MGAKFSEKNVICTPSSIIDKTFFFDKIGLNIKIPTNTRVFKYIYLSKNAHFIWMTQESQNVIRFKDGALVSGITEIGNKSNLVLNLVLKYFLENKLFFKRELLNYNHYHIYLLAQKRNSSDQVELRNNTARNRGWGKKMVKNGQKLTFGPPILSKIYRISKIEKIHAFRNLFSFLKMYISFA